MSQSFIDNYIGVLNSLLCRTHEGNKKYLFIVDSTDLSIEIMKQGYSSVSIGNMQELNQIADIMGRANMAANNVITIGCCNSSVNSAIRDAIYDTRYINGYKIYNNNKEYYQLNPSKIKSNIEKFIAELEQGNNETPSKIPTIRTFEDITEKSVDWLWYPYIPRAMLTALGADPGTGKTFECCYIAAKVSKGEALEDNPFIEPVKGNIMMFNSEDSPETVLKPRLRLLGANMKNIIAPENTSDPNFMPYSFDDDRLEILFDTYKPVLAFFDPIQSYLGAGIDMHRANETRPLFAKLQALAERHNTAIVIVSHLSKMTTQDVYYRFLGSIDFMGAVRSALYLGKHPNNKNIRVLFHIKQNGTAPGDNLAYTIKNGVWVPDNITDVSELTPEDCVGHRQRQPKTDTKKDKAITLINKAFDERADRTNAINVSELKKIAEDNGIDWNWFARQRPDNVKPKHFGKGENQVHYWERVENV